MYQNKANFTALQNSVLCGNGASFESVQATVANTALVSNSSQNAGASFGNLQSAGTKVLLHKLVANNSANLLATNINGYSYLIVEVTSLVATNDQGYFAVYYSADNGTTSLTTGYQVYGITSVSQGGGGYAGYNASQNWADFSVAGAALTSPAGPGVCGTFYFFGLDSPNYYKMMMCDACALIYPFSAQAMQSSRGCVMVSPNVIPTVNCLNFSYTNGTIASGTVCVYGVV